jgi:serine/threonine protein kinase
VESEIRILQQLRHEGLVSYAFIADEGSRISIVMPWAGTPLREHRAAAGAAYDSEDAARHIAHQLASALAYLHGRGILHRDVKPDNLGVLEGERLRLFDWGEAVSLADIAGVRGAGLRPQPGRGRRLRARLGPCDWGEGGSPGANPRRLRHCARPAPALAPGPRVSLRLPPAPPPCRPPPRPSPRR